MKHDQVGRQAGGPGGRSRKMLVSAVLTLATATGLGLGNLSPAAAKVTATKAPLPADAARNPQVGLQSVSCASAGNCTAVGHYNDSSGHRQGLLLTQTAGSWTAAKAPLPAGAGSTPFVNFDSVSCASAGNCTAVGIYRDSSGNQQGLLLTQTAGSWAAAKAPVPAGAATNPGVSLSSVSCASAGNCTAVGHYNDSSGDQPGLLLTQTAGSWTAAKAPLPVGAALNQLTFLEAVSCLSPGNCTAVGGYIDSSSNFQGLLLTQTAGSWTAAKAPMPAGAAPSPLVAFDSMACVSAGNCTAVGSYNDRSINNEQGLLLTQIAGRWVAAKAPLPAGAATSPFAVVGSVSCGAAGNCAAVGSYLDSLSNMQGVLLTQSARTWAGAKAPLPAGAATNPGVTLSSVSCGAAGNCMAVGFYIDGSGSVQGLLLTQSAGRWAAARAPLPAGAAADPFAGLFSVACASAGHCTAIGDYTDRSGHVQGVLLTR